MTMLMEAMSSAANGSSSSVTAAPDANAAASQTLRFDPADNMYSGLWYPVIIAGMTFVIGMLFVRETKDVDIYAND